MIKYISLAFQFSIFIMLICIIMDLKKTILSSNPIESYSITCVDNISYIVFNNHTATVKYDLEGNIETCDLGEE